MDSHEISATLTARGDCYLVAYLATVGDAVEVKPNHARDNYTRTRLEDCLQKLDCDNWKEVVRSAYKFFEAVDTN